MEKTKCPDCEDELKQCCIDFILMGRPKSTDSELQKLLKKNAYGMGLTTIEERKARELIHNPELSKEDCSHCRVGEKEKAIFDTGLLPQTRKICFTNSQIMVFKGVINLLSWLNALFLPKIHTKGSKISLPCCITGVPFVEKIIFKRLPFW